MSFGIICYKNSINLGDQIQSLAAKKLLQQNKINHIDYFVDRDKNIIYDFRGNVVENIFHNKLHCIYNGWFDKDYMKFPLHPMIHPLFISYHVNETTKDSTYNWLKSHEINEKKSLCDLSYISEYNKSEYDIGCRDNHTAQKFMQNKYKNVYVSGCLTMTLPKDISEIRNKIYIVDVNVCDIKQHVPKKILNNAIYLSHVYKGNINDEADKFEQAEKLLRLYQNAKLVITSRLHCALPCLAYNTPVVFSYYNMNDVRLKGLIDTIPVVGKHKIDWDNLSIMLPANWNEQVCNMKTTVEKWVEKSKNDY